jgi:hypothetical protein
VNDDVVINSMVRSSHLYSHFAAFELTIAQRTRGDAAFDAWLGALSVNRAPGPVPVPDGELPPTARRVFIPEECFSTTSVDDALVWLFGPVPSATVPFRPLNPRYALLSVLNKTVDEVNNLVLERYVEGNVMQLHAAHQEVADSDANEDRISRQHATVEYMAGMTESGVPSSILRLKKGSVVMLMRNMLSTLGMVNGTRLLVLSDPPADGGGLPLLHVETVPQPGSGEEPARHFLPRITFEMTTPGGLKFHRHQFPVRLAYAITGNKSQGATLIKCLADTRHEPFAHGVGYVMASRTTSSKTLGYLHAPLPEGEEGRGTFVNYVLQRALAPGVLAGGEARQRAAPGTMVEGEDVGSAEDSSSEEDARAPKRKRQRKVKVGPQPAAFQKGAMKLQQRREDTYKRVKKEYVA